MNNMNIGINIDTGEDVLISLEKFIDTRAILTASSGGGKSWGVRKFLQESYGKVQQIILDWEGEYSNLRPEFDYLLVGDDGEIPIQVKTAEILAKKIMQLSVSTIIDLSDLTIHDRKLFTRNFLDSLLSLPKEMYNHSILLFIDEAHLLCPQKGNSESMNSVINVNSTGRKRGIGTVLCTQRIAKLNKDAVAESRNGAMGGMGLLEDRKRACDEMGFNTKALEQSIRLLDTGIFYMYGPAISKEVIKVKIGDVKIKPPKPGQKLITKDKTPEAIKKILQSLTDLPKEAETELKSKEDMKKKIIELKTELRRRPTEMKIKEVIKVDDVALEKAQIRGFKEAEIGYEKKIKVLQSSFKKKVIEVDTFHKKNNIITSNELNKLKQKMNKINQIASGENNIRVEHPIHDSPKEISLDVEIPKMDIPTPKVSTPISAPTQIQKQTPSNDHTGDELYDEDGEPIKFTLCARKIYSFLFANQDKEFSRVQLATITGYSHKSGGFGDALSKLNVLKLIKKNGDMIKIGDLNPAVASEDMQELSIQSWYGRLNKCARTILKLLMDNPYESFDRSDLAEKTGYSAISGGFGDAISKLNVLGMLTKEGSSIKINPEILELE